MEAKDRWRLLRVRHEIVASGVGAVNAGLAEFALDNSSAATIKEGRPSRSGSGGESHCP